MTEELPDMLNDVSCSFTLIPQKLFSEIAGKALLGLAKLNIHAHNFLDPPLDGLTSFEIPGYVPDYVTLLEKSGISLRLPNKVT